MKNNNEAAMMPLTKVHHFADYIRHLADARIAGIFLEKKVGGIQFVLRNMNKKPFIQTTAFISNPGNACCGKCSKKKKKC